MWFSIDTALVVEHGGNDALMDGGVFKGNITQPCVGPALSPSWLANIIHWEFTCCRRLIEFDY